MRGIVWLLLFLCSSFAEDIQKRDHYVCNSFIDYYLFKTINPHCHYNPDVGDLSTNILTRHGYKISTYNVETEDGYIVLVERVQTERKTPKGVIFFGHPYTSSAIAWVDKGKNMSLALMLVDEGYEVWLLNSRGTRLSQGHKYLTVKDKKFWDYSFHEIGVYDLPPAIKIAKNVSGAEKMTFIGHSAGSTSALIYASLRKDEAKDAINMFITMSPVSYLAHPKFPIPLIYPVVPLLKLFVDLVGDEIDQKILTFITYNLVRYMPLLFLVIIDVFQYTPQQKYPPHLPLLTFSLYQSTNLKQILHYIQISKVKRFQQYDYGAIRNKKIYGNERPPEYPVSDIEVPVQIIYSDKDAFFGPQDSQVLYDKLKGTAKTYEPYNAKTFNHFDYIYGKYVNNLYKWTINKIDSIQ